MSSCKLANKSTEKYYKLNPVFQKFIKYMDLPENSRKNSRKNRTRFNHWLQKQT